MLEIKLWRLRFVRRVSSTLAPSHHHDHKGSYEQSCDEAQGKATDPEQRRENQGDHNQGRNVEDGGAVHHGKGAFDPHPPLPKGGGDGHDAGRAEVHHRADGEALERPFESALGWIAATACHWEAVDLWEEEGFGQTGHHKGKGHADGNQAQVGDRKVPPSGEEGGIRLAFDTEALKAFHLGRGDGVQVLPHGVQLGEAAEGKKQGQDYHQEKQPDRPFLAECRTKHLYGETRSR